MNCTLDTNILVYTVGSSSDPKPFRARDLIIRGMRSGTTILMLQSLAEFSNVATRELGIDPDSVRRRVQAWGKVMPVQAAAEQDLVGAPNTPRPQASILGCLAVRHGNEGGGRHLLTEDLQNGQSLHGLAIVNPFLPGNAALIDSILPP